MLMMDKIIFEVLMALIVAIGGIIAKSLIPYLKQKEEEALIKLRQTEFAWCADIVEAVVRAVEQTVSEEIHGKDKKDIAVKYINEILNQNGIAISADQVDKLIEAAVNAMNQQTIQIEVPDEVPDEE